MAKNYKKESYAINKYSNGIVYIGVKSIFELTLEQFLKENPNMSQSDFEYWKNISDELYKEEDLRTMEISKRSVSINEIAETRLMATESAEDAFFRLEDTGNPTREDIVNAQFIYDLAKKVLTAIQYERFFKYYSEGKKLKEIAKIEGVNFASVSRSILLSERKIKKVLGEICKKHSILDVI